MNNWEAHRTIILTVVAALLLLLLTYWAVSGLIEPRVARLDATKEKLKEELLEERPERSRKWSLRASALQSRNAG